MKGACEPFSDAGKDFSEKCSVAVDKRTTLQYILPFPYGTNLWPTGQRGLDLSLNLIFDNLVDSCVDGIFG